MLQSDIMPNDELDPMKGLPSKRFGLFTVGSDGRPDTLEGRFDSYYELMERCGANPTGHYVVEVAHFAYLTLGDFAGLFGPLPRVRQTHTNNASSS
jgi:hypothetical protein